MSKQLYCVYGDFDFEMLVWSPMKWVADDSSEPKFIAFESEAEAQQCAAAVGAIKGGHSDNQRHARTVNVNAFDADALAGRYVMYGDVDEAWPEV